MGDSTCSLLANESKGNHREGAERRFFAHAVRFFAYNVGLYFLKTTSFGHEMIFSLFADADRKITFARNQGTKFNNLTDHFVKGI
jgi:hypothetical protein